MGGAYFVHFLEPTALMGELKIEVLGTPQNLQDLGGGVEALPAVVALCLRRRNNHLAFGGGVGVFFR